MANETAIAGIEGAAAEATSMTARVSGVVLAERAGRGWWLLFGIAAALLALGVAMTLQLFIAGIGIWGVNRPVAWGLAIVNYVWWIAIASGGTLISAVLYLTGAEWRAAITRFAETMTLCGAACAGIYPILHLGRPQYFYWLFPYPDTMALWPQFRSPLLWDFAAILAYVLGSILFWYYGLIPDLATMRDRAATRRGQVLYGIFALGWRGSSRQWRAYRAGYGLVAALMTVLVVSVHSIVGLDFAGGLSPGWHSTIFPPYFVVGAMLSGFAAVIALAIPVRAAYGFEDLITPRHLDMLARLLLASSLLIALCYALDIASALAGEAAERKVALARFDNPIWWATIAGNVVLPQLLWWRRLRADTRFLFALSLVVIATMWCERFLIVTSLAHDFLPAAWGRYVPTFADWAVMLGTIGFYVGSFLVFLRLLPALAMAEMRGVAAGRPT